MTGILFESKLDNKCFCETGKKFYNVSYSEWAQRIYLFEIDTYHSWIVSTLYKNMNYLLDNTPFLFHTCWSICVGLTPRLPTFTCAADPILPLNNFTHLPGFVLHCHFRNTSPFLSYIFSRPSMAIYSLSDKLKFYFWS